MSVLLETTAGDLVIDLFLDSAEPLCINFLKLCKVKYFNFSPIHTILKNISCQLGDPLGPLSPSSTGGSSIYGLLGIAPRLFPVPLNLDRAYRHRAPGIVSMVVAEAAGGVHVVGSQFVISLSGDCAGLDGRAVPFGEVVEGLDVLGRINAAITDERGHPLVDIRVLHTIVLDDPTPDPEGLERLIPRDGSLGPSEEQLATVRIANAEVLKEGADIDEETAEKQRREKEAAAQALTLEMLGDLPFASVSPPENILFVCKLNPVTTSADLALIFSRFGEILNCEVVRDRKTGDSLQYAFIEFKEKEACERAYFKMQGVLVDDRRIHVDFSQSVRGVVDGEGQRRAGGFGGVWGLEKRGQYRDYDEGGRGGYKFVLEGDREERKRSRSPRKRDWRHRGRRERERGGGGGRDKRDDDHRHRDWNEGRERDRDRDHHSNRDSGDRRDRERGGGRDGNRHRRRDDRYR